MLKKTIPSMAAGAALCLTLALSTQGCSPIHHDSVNAPGTNAVVHYPEGGGTLVAIDSGNEDFLCALPPNEAAELLERALPMNSTEADSAEESDVRDGSPAEAKSLAELQAERPQFLEWALYRLCEARANGFLAGRCDVYELDLARQLRQVDGENEEAKKKRETALAAAQNSYAACMNSCSALEEGWSKALSAELSLTKKLDKSKQRLEPAAKARSKESRRAAFEKNAEKTATKAQKATREEKARLLAHAAELRKSAEELKLSPKESAFLADYKRLAEDAKTARRGLTQARERTKEAANLYRSCQSHLRGDYRAEFRHLIDVAKELHKMDLEIARLELEKEKREEKAKRGSHAAHPRTKAGKAHAHPKGP